jgi:hypothetical protein
MSPPGPTTQTGQQHVVLKALQRSWEREIILAYRAQVERSFGDDLATQFDLENFFYTAIGLGHLIATYDALLAITDEAQPAGVFDVLQQTLRSGRAMSKLKNAKAMFRDFRLPAGYGQMLSTLMTPWRVGPSPYSDNQEYALIGDLRPAVTSLKYQDIIQVFDGFTTVFHNTVELRGILRDLDLPFESWEMSPEVMPTVMDLRPNVNSLQWYAFLNHGIASPVVVSNNQVPLFIQPWATANPNSYTLGWLPGVRALEQFIYTRHEFTLGVNGGTPEYVHFPGLFPMGGVGNTDYDAFALAITGADPTPMRWNLFTFAADGDVLVYTTKGQQYVTPTSGLQITLPRIDRALADLAIARVAAPHVIFDVGTGTWTPLSATAGLNVHRNGHGVNPQRYPVLDITTQDYRQTGGLTDLYVQTVLEMCGLRMYDQEHLNVDL